jgi:hypothetical protein
MMPLFPTLPPSGFARQGNGVCRCSLCLALVKRVGRGELEGVICHPLLAVL